MKRKETLPKPALAAREQAFNVYFGGANDELAQKFSKLANEMARKPRLITRSVPRPQKATSLPQLDGKPLNKWQIRGKGCPAPFLLPKEAPKELPCLRAATQKTGPAFLAAATNKENENPNRKKFASFILDKKRAAPGNSCSHFSLLMRKLELVKQDDALIARLCREIDAHVESKKATKVDRSAQNSTANLQVVEALQKSESKSQLSGQNDDSGEEKGSEKNESLSGIIEDLNLCNTIEEKAEKSQSFSLSFVNQNGDASFKSESADEVCLF